MISKVKVYVDGQSGTTGLQIHQRLAAHPYVEVLKIAEANRKEYSAREAIINAADIVFLCLPDIPAKEAAQMIRTDNKKTRLIDASTAHRVNPDWVYGLPELSQEARNDLAKSRRTAVPGCHASAFILPLYPLIKAGIVPNDYPITSHSITGYSGGGKEMIAQYKNLDRNVLYPDFDAPRQYALGLKHKHLPEMQKKSGLTYSPSFSPIVGDFERGLAVFTPLHKRLLKYGSDKEVSRELIYKLLTEHYANQKFVHVMPFDPEQCLGDPFFNIKACNNTNRAEIFVFGSQEVIMLACRLDNLGKGASGAAIQNMNIMCGFPEDMSLT